MSLDYDVTSRDFVGSQISSNNVFSLYITYFCRFPHATVNWLHSPVAKADVKIMPKTPQMCMAYFADIIGVATPPKLYL